MMNPEAESMLPETPPASGAQETPDGTACPFCRGTLAPEATKCSHCGSNVGDIKTCPRCAEAVRSSALTCPFCSTDLTPPAPEETALLAEPWVVYASPIGAAITEQSPTAIIFPPILTVGAKEIHIRRRSFLGLRTMDQKLAVDRVASVRALSGVIWSAIVIETYGGASGDLAISGLNKEEARETAAIIEGLAHLKGSGSEKR